MPRSNPWAAPSQIIEAVSIILPHALKYRHQLPTRVIDNTEKEEVKPLIWQPIDSFAEIGWSSTGEAWKRSIGIR